MKNKYPQSDCKKYEITYKNKESLWSKNAINEYKININDY